MDMNLGKLPEVVRVREARCASVHGVSGSRTRLGSWTTKTTHEFSSGIKSSHEKNFTLLFFPLTWPVVIFMFKQTTLEMFFKNCAIINYVDNAGVHGSNWYLFIGISVLDLERNRFLSHSVWTLVCCFGKPWKKFSSSTLMNVSASISEIHKLGLDFFASYLWCNTQHLNLYWQAITAVFTFRLLDFWYLSNIKWSLLAFKSEELWLTDLMVCVSCIELFLLVLLLTPRFFLSKSKIVSHSAVGFLNTVLICEADSNMVLCPRDFVNFLTRNR